MSLLDLFRRRNAPLAHVETFVTPERGARIVILGPGERFAPVTCAEAGRDGYYTRKARESERYRATAITLAEKIGRPDLAAAVSDAQKYGMEPETKREGSS